MSGADASACVLGCSGLVLTDWERDFFADARPWGFILFARNIDTPAQVRALTDALRAACGRPEAPVLVDQEGGRVQRLGPPHWRRYPPGAAFGRLSGGLLEQRMIARLGGRLIANDLAPLGINVDCAPVLDVPAPDGHEVIGDRAYAPDPDAVAVLGRAAAEGLIAGGVLPVIKHIPGHGRARADSHLALPVVEASLEALREHDFAPFRALSDMPVAMTAHVVYAAIDDQRPATASPKVIDEVIRGHIGFDGLLITDDLSMKALSGDIAARARDCLEAGCDIVLHCNGDPAEMLPVAEAAGPLTGAARARAQAALARIPRAVEPLDVEAAQACFETAFARGANP